MTSSTDSRLASITGAVARAMEQALSSQGRCAGAPPAWLAGFLEEMCRTFTLGGCAVLAPGPKRSPALAVHGLSADRVARLIENLASIPHCPEAPEDGPETSQVSRQELTQSEQGQEDRGAYAAFRTRAADGRALVTVFALDAAQAELLDEPLRLVTFHVAGLVATARLREELSGLKEKVEKRDRELKEMQVCSLNIMEDLQKKNRDLAMLNRISREITGSTSLPEVAKVATEAISGAFDGVCASLYVTNAQGTAFRPYNTTGSLVGDADDLDVRVSDGLGARILAGEEVTIDASEETPGFPLAKAVGAKSCLLVPLCSKDKPLGFIAVCETRWHRVFTDDEKDNLRVLAGTMSVAIQNSNLLSRTASQIEEINLLKEYIETVVDSVDLAVMVVGVDLRINMINKGFERMHGEAREKYLGRHLSEAYPNLVDQGIEEITKQVLQGRPFVRFGWRRRTLGGKDAVQNIRVFPHRATGGEIIGAIVVVEDITEKTDLEVQLARSEAKFRTLVEDLGDGYLIATGGKIVYANRAASQMTGIPAAELINTDVSRILSDECPTECPEPAGKRTRCEARLVHSAGTRIPVEISVNTCDYGGDKSASIVIRDITERRKIEKQLELKNREMSVRNQQVTRLNSELEATVTKLKESQENLIKSERVAAITETSVAANHEINNPLFAILGQAQLLLRRYGDKDEDTSLRLKTIEESALRIACVTKKLANLAEPVVKEYVGLATSMIDVDKSTSR
jgi:PAS domain S-box-containing protein